MMSFRWLCLTKQTVSYIIMADILGFTTAFRFSPHFTKWSPGPKNDMPCPRYIRQGTAKAFGRAPACFTERVKKRGHRFPGGRKNLLRLQKVFLHCPAVPEMIYNKTELSAERSVFYPVGLSAEGQPGGKRNTPEVIGYGRLTDRMHLSGSQDHGRQIHLLS